MCTSHVMWYKIRYYTCAYTYVYSCLPVYIFCSFRWLSVVLPLLYVSCIFLKHLLFTTASKAAGLYLKQAFVIISMWLVYAVYVSSTRQTLVFQHYAVNTNSTVRCPFQIKSPLMFLCIQQTRQCLATTHSCTCFPDCRLFAIIYTLVCSPAKYPSIAHL